MNKRLFQPVLEIDTIKNIPFGRKTLGDSAGGFKAACYVLHRCHLARHTQDSEWVPLWSQMMAKVARDAATWIRTREILIAYGFLECDQKYRKGQKSFSFRLGASLRNVNWKLSTEAFSFDLPAPQNVWSGLSIDKNKAHQILEQIVNWPKYEKWTTATLDCWHYRIDEFSNDYNLGKTGRIFGDANMMPSPVREALRIHGEKTLEIDIKNSQPCLLSTLYRAPSEEQARYKNLVESGQIYEVFAKELKIKRDKAKLQFLMFIFGNTKDTEEFAAVFESQFPILAGLIQAERKKHFKALVYNLQRMEAKIILDACEKFVGVSIHDGIRVVASKAYEAKAYIEGRMKEVHDLEPRLTVEK